jgi:putative Mn2+ efflux pump MntP
MSGAEIILLAIGLCFDTFAVSLSSGICLPQIPRLAFIRIVLTFASVQAVLTMTGWFAGKGLLSFISPVDHWIAFAILLYIGIKMIKDSMSDDRDVCLDLRRAGVLISASVATSIDALAVGVGLAIASVNLKEIGVASVVIFVATLIASIAGIKWGRYVGLKAGKRSGVVGGVILIAIGIKILVEHLEILN